VSDVRMLAHRASRSRSRVGVGVSVVECELYAICMSRSRAYVTSMTSLRLSVNVSVNVNQNFFSVAKIAKLLRSPQRRSRVTIQNQEMTVEKEMFLDVDGKEVEMEMTECQLAVSSKGVVQRLERSVDRRL